ncbi:MAG: phosphorylase family protein [Limisphaerales bacterium]
MESLVLVCFAVPEEARPFRRLAPTRAHVQILVTGIGRQNARNAIRAALSAHSPRLVLTCGFAGALHPDLARGTVVFDADEESTLTPALNSAGAVHARFLCLERVLSTVAEKQAARQTSAADAVEMESAAIRAACRERGIASATVRVISDAATEDLPLDFNAFLTPGNQMNYARLVFALLRSPGKIGALLKLRRQCQAAAEALARVLVRIIPDQA